MRARACAMLMVMLAAGIGVATVFAPPAAAGCGLSVNSITPAIGFTTGGASTTIAGCDFTGTGTLSVTFGTNAGTSLSIVNDGSLTVNTPAAASAGSVTVTVTLTDGGSTSTATTSFLYVAPPHISSIVPTQGAESGGTAVHVTGTDLSPSGSVTTVAFGANAAAVSDVTNSTLTATSPAGSGTQNVTVTVTLAGGAAETSNGLPFTYIPAPVVSSVSPTSGPVTGGTDVTVTGMNFQPGAEVFFGTSDGSGTTLHDDLPANPVAVLSATSILATAPPGIVGATNVVVLNPDGQHGALAAADAGHYSYTGTTPTISSVSPSSGSSLGGTVVQINGAGFLPGAIVTFSAGETHPPAASSVTVSTDGTIINAKTPPHASGAVDVTITNQGGGTATKAAAFTYTAAAAPTVTNVVANNGTSLGGTTVTISGSNFAGGAAVTFGTTSANQVSVLNSGAIQAITPGHPAGTVGVTVTLSDGQSATLANAFTFNAASAPSITSITPNTGPGGTQITIAGTGFANTNGSSTNAGRDAIVSVGSAACVAGTTSPDSTCLQPLPPVPPAVTSPPIVVSDTTIQGLVPNAPGGAATVTITNPDGQTATSTFTYTGPSGTPTFTSISPNSGPSLGGTLVTLTGTNFVHGAAVSFGGSGGGAQGAQAVAGSIVVSDDGTSISARTPAGLYGVYDVTVTNPGGLAVTLTDGFTFSASAQPTITSVTPSSGPSGTQITITGTGFANTNGGTTNAAAPAVVTVGGLPLLPLAPTGTPPTTPPVVVSDTSITGIVPTGQAGAVDVAVVNPDGQGAIDVGAYTYPSDTTAPTVNATGQVGTLSYTFGTWANGHVIVTLTASDNGGGSGVKSISYSATGAQPLTLTTVTGSNAALILTAEGTTTLSFSAMDIAGNVSSTQTVDVKIDTVAPSLLVSATIPSGGGTVSYTSGSATNQNVTVTFSCSDARSGVATLVGTTGSANTQSGTNPLSVTVTSSGDGQSVTGTCTDNAGNQTSSTFGGIDITRTAPTITAHASAGGAPYTPGTWTNQTVTVTFSCTPLSVGNQIANLTTPVQVNGPTTNQTVTGTCTDTAGNSSSITFGTPSSGIDVDLTLPIATATATTTNNLGATVPYVAGTWTNHDVVVTFHCTDSGPNQSGVAIATLTPPATISAQGTTSGVTGGCADVAGNHANPPAFFGPILIDKTAPTCSVAVTPNPIGPANNKLDGVKATVNVNDSLSGANGFLLISVVSNQPATASSDITGFTVGSASTTGQLRATKGRVYTFTYQGFDIAANASSVCTVQVFVR
jgi:hypothetical protein